MIWNHPSVRQVNILLKLDCDHFRIDLDNSAFQPVTDSFTIFLMITEDFDAIPHRESLIQIWYRCKM